MTFEFGPNQTRWLEILESGDLPQAKGYLHCSEGMCCLGVAAVHVLNEDSVQQGAPDEEDGPDWINLFPEADDGAGTELDKDYARTELGLRTGTGHFSPSQLCEEDREAFERLRIPPGIACLAQLNDRGWSFAQIAQFIRRNPEAVFTHAA